VVQLHDYIVMNNYIALMSQDNNPPPAHH